MSLNTVIYAGNGLGPANIDHNTPDILASGFTTILLGLFHIGRGPNAHDPVSGQKTGDIVFNNPNDPNDPGVIVVSDGNWVAPSTWPGQLKNLFSTTGKVTKMGCSVGGAVPAIEDYQTIWANFVENGAIGPDTVLYENFAKLNDVLPFASFVDFDCEEFDSSYDPTYDWKATLVAFGKMLKEIGFDLTLCPFEVDQAGDWMDVLTALYTPPSQVTTPPPTVVWMNLQCYSGGDDNHPNDWVTAVEGTNLGIDAGAFTVPGLSTETTPREVAAKFAAWQQVERDKNLPLLQGGFIWNYDDILQGGLSASAYQQAIVKGLGS